MADPVGGTFIERLHNAIQQMAFVSGRGTPAWDLAEAWKRNVWDSTLRTSGALLPVLWGSLQGYWTRYAEIYADDLTDAERAELPTPESVRPRAANLLDEVQRQIIDSNLEVAMDAANRAYEAQDAILTVYKGAEKRVAFLAVAALLGLYLWKKK